MNTQIASQSTEPITCETRGRTFDVAEVPLLRVLNTALAAQRLDPKRIQLVPGQHSTGGAAQIVRQLYRESCHARVN